MFNKLMHAWYSCKFNELMQVHGTHASSINSYKCMATYANGRYSCKCMGLSCKFNKLVQVHGTLANSISAWDSCKFNKLVQVHAWDSCKDINFFSAALE
jgi:hypothetical protein